MSQSQSLPEPHDLALEFPEMPEAEFRELVEDIRNNGLREMITLLDGKILDGRHRAKALVELGWPLEEYCEHFDTSCGDLVEYVISRNVRRRHLTAKERVAIVLKLYETKGKKRISEPKTDDRRDIETGKKVSHVVENQGKRQLSHPPTTDVTVREIAKAANVSTRTVERYKAEQAGRRPESTRTMICIEDLVTAINRGSDKGGGRVKINGITLIVAVSSESQEHVDSVYDKEYFPPVWFSNPSEKRKAMKKPTVTIDDLT